MSGLPQGWAVVPAGELGDWRGGGTPSKSNDAFWTGGTIPWVSPKDMKRQYISDAEDHITEAAIAGSATQRVPENSILMVTRSGILQHSLPVAINTVPVTVNQDLKALSPFEGISPAYILRHLQADAQRILEAASKTGTTVESIDFDRLKAYPIRLAPFPEQKRIVTKVDGLTARTARARADLDRIPTLIARYKQRLLALAFSGELTAGWRREGALPLFHSEQSNEESDGAERGKWDFSSLPEGWVWKRFEQIFDDVTDSRRKLQTKDYQVVGAFPIVDQGMQFIAGYTDQEEYVQKAAPPYIIFGDHTRCIKLVEERFVQGADGTKVLTLFEGHLPRFYYYALQCVDLPNKGYSRHMKFLRATIFPHCDSEEQAEVVHRIESAFNWLDRIAADHAAAANLLPKLDAAILDKAFRGELVPQDPNDEPASALLARIKGEKLYSTKISRGRNSGFRSDGMSDRFTPFPIPRTTKESAMSKSRQDEDVMDKPYLANLLKAGHGASAQDLFKAADLPVADFYKQLAWEIAQKHIRDDDEKLEAL